MATSDLNMGVNQVFETSEASHIAQIVATLQYTSNCDVMKKSSSLTFQNKYPCNRMCVHCVTICTQVHVTNEYSTVP
jgi:hypothetical protein